MQDVHQSLLSAAAALQATLLPSRQRMPMRVGTPIALLMASAAGGARLPASWVGGGGGTVCLHLPAVVVDAKPVAGRAPAGQLVGHPGAQQRHLPLKAACRGGGRGRGGRDPSSTDPHKRRTAASQRCNTSAATALTCHHPLVDQVVAPPVGCPVSKVPASTPRTGEQATAPPPLPAHMQSGAHT